MWLVMFFSISLGRLVVQPPHSPQKDIAIKLSKIYEKLHCKGEPHRFGGWRDPSVQTERHPVTLF